MALEREGRREGKREAEEGRERVGVLYIYTHNADAVPPIILSDSKSFFHRSSTDHIISSLSSSRRRGDTRLASNSVDHPVTNHHLTPVCTSAW